MNDRVWFNHTLDDSDTIGFIAHHERQCAALALANGNDNAALSGLVRYLTAINTIFSKVCRANMSAEMRAIDFANAVNGCILGFRFHRFAKLVNQDPCRFMLHIDIARQLQA